jgi:lysophospholipase L1-like esterase
MAILMPADGSAAPPSKPIKIVAFGDSTTFGYLVTDNYPRQLGRRLEKHRIAATVLNSGVNGDTTSSAAKRFERDVLAHDPEVVIIQFGLNDQTIRWYEDPRTTKTYVSQEEYAKNLRRFVSELHSRHIKVILMTPNPMCWTETLERHYPDGPFLDPPNGGNLLLERYVEAVREVTRAEDTPLVDVFDHFNKHENKSNKGIHELFLDDGVHPNERGYELIVDKVIPLIVKGVKSERDDGR